MVTSERMKQKNNNVHKERWTIDKVLANGKPIIKEVKCCLHQINFSTKCYLNGVTLEDYTLVTI